MDMIKSARTLNPVVMSILTVGFLAVSAHFVAAQQTPMMAGRNFSASDQRIATLEARLAKLERMQQPRARRAYSPPAAPTKTQFAPSPRAALASIAPQLQQMQGSLQRVRTVSYNATPATVPLPQIDPTAANIQALQANVNALTVTVKQLTQQLNDAKQKINDLSWTVGLQNVALNSSAQSLATLQSDDQSMAQQLDTDAQDLKAVSQVVSFGNGWDEFSYLQESVYRMAADMTCYKDAFGNQEFPDMPQVMMGPLSTRPYNCN